MPQVWGGEGFGAPGWARRKPDFPAPLCVSISYLASQPQLSCLQNGENDTSFKGLFQQRVTRGPRIQGSCQAYHFPPDGEAQVLR